jgi:hypothetical protein
VNIRGLLESPEGRQGKYVFNCSRAGFEIHFNETYLELRSGYDCVIRMLLRLSQSLDEKSKSYYR